MLSILRARQIWNQHADPTHLGDIARHIWGPDSDAMMKDFNPTDTVLMKYDHKIVCNERAIRGQRVLDMGCNHGLWSYMAHRHGASHVVGIEPRGMFVKGLNAFAQQHDLPMEFHKGYDTDMGRLLHNHRIDTVLLTGVENITQWENMLLDIRKSSAKWLIMQVGAIPDAWVDFTSAVFDFAKSTGSGMPIGFSLYFESHNTDTMSGLNPLYKEQADPETGYQHIDPDGKFDINRSRCITNMRSRQYIRKFIEHVGFTVESTILQENKAQDTAGTSASNGLYQWYLLRNEK